MWKSYDFIHDAADLLEFFKDEPHVFFLDSSLRSKDRGRYSFFGFDPFKIFQSKDKGALPALKEEFAPYKISNHTLPFPFASGIVGYLSYDYGLYQEKIQLTAHDDLNLPYCFFGFYDCVFIIDHLKNKLYISSSGWPEKNISLQKKRAVSRLDYFEGKLKSFLKKTNEPKNIFKKSPRHNFFLPGNFTKQQYTDAVKKALDYIAAGDIYQVNLSQRFQWNSNGTRIDPIQIYKALRRISPSYFSSFLNCGFCQILSSSPERYMSLQGNRVQTQPMKGTRPRGKTQTQDRKLKKEILMSPKERAELLMITDLERNDLGRVCRFGSVQVKNMRAIEEYKTVFQATSTIEGILKKGKDAFDVIESTFPGGSITGCPKIRAMEIIEELESIRRGIYTGILGYVGFDGNMDFSMLIRTLLMKDKDIYFQVGGGIVADSNPLREYEETLVKAKALRDAIG